MDRRAFLRATGALAGALAGGGWLAACSGGTEDAGGIPGGEASINVVNASYETLAGDERRLNLVVTEVDRTPIAGADLAVFVRDLEGGEVRSGPHPATYHDESGTGTGSGVGLYQTVLPLPTPGLYEVVGVVGDRYGAAAVSVVDPASSGTVAPGDAAVGTATPTTADALGVAAVCTEDPPCGMHDASLDAALADGRPVMLLFATPAYCQTVACGPSVANLEAVRGSRDWGDVAFVHCEIYAEPPGDGEPVLVQAVRDWNLPTEPWLFAVGRDGLVVDRLDGPMLDEDMARLAAQLV